MSRVPLPGNECTVVGRARVPSRLRQWGQREIVWEHLQGTMGGWAAGVFTKGPGSCGHGKRDVQMREPDFPRETPRSIVRTERWNRETETLGPGILR